MKLNKLKKNELEMLKVVLEETNQQASKRYVHVCEELERRGK